MSAVQDPSAREAETQAVAVADDALGTGEDLSRSRLDTSGGRFSNIHLVDWDLFQTFFTDRWHGTTTVGPGDAGICGMAWLGPC